MRKNSKKIRGSRSKAPVVPNPDQKLVDKYNKAGLEADIQMQIASRQNDQFRGRSVTVGSTGGDGIEINIRMQNGFVAYMPMSHHHAVELAHQIAAQAGCHIAIKPREDFASHRQWNDDTPMLGAVFKQDLLGYNPDQNLLLAKQEVEEAQQKLQRTINNEYVDNQVKILPESHRKAINQD